MEDSRTLVITQERKQRDNPLDLIRGMGVVLFFIGHYFWLLWDENPARDLHWINFLTVLPGGFFYIITGASVGYSRGGLKNKKNIKIGLIKSLILMVISINPLMDGPLFYIGLFNITLIFIVLIFKHNKKKIVIFLSFCIIFIVILSLLGYNMPKNFNWPLIPWYIAPMIGCIIIELFPESTNYSNYTINIKNLRSLIFLLIGFINLVIYFIFFNNNPRENQLIAIYLSFSMLIFFYGLFGLFYPIAKLIDPLKILSKYSLYVWFFHWGLLGLLFLIGITHHTLTEFILQDISFIFFNYLVFKIVDLYLRKRRLLKSPYK